MIAKLAAVVVTLKETVPPLFTLMSVANPWIVASPDPVMSHSDLGLPGSWFSAGIGLLAWAVTRGPAICSPNMSARKSVEAPIVRRRNIVLVMDVIVFSGRRIGTPNSRPFVS